MKVDRSSDFSLLFFFFLEVTRSRVFACRLPLELWGKLVEYANEEALTPSAAIRRILIKFFRDTNGNIKNNSPAKRGFFV